MARPKRPKDDEQRLTASLPTGLKQRFAIQAIRRGLEQRELLIEILEVYFARLDRKCPSEKRH